MDRAAAASRGLIVFDLDGTLVDTLEDLAASANRMLARYHRPPMRADALRPMVGDGVPALARRVLAHDRGRGGLPLDEAAAIRDFADDYAANATRGSRPFPGVPETLRRLRDEGWDLAVCTNKPERDARLVLEALGIAPLLSAVGGGDSFPTRKPDPGHLLGTIRAAGGAVDRALLVGDHANDVAAARAAGIPCIFALWGYGRPAVTEHCLPADAVTRVPDLAAALLPPLRA